MYQELFDEHEADFGVHAKIDWMPRIGHVVAIGLDNIDNVEVAVRVLYFLHNCVLEEEHTESEHDSMHRLLESMFRLYNNRFMDNAYYLYFLGCILNVAEWYFGLDDTDVAEQFQRKAAELEPGNILYYYGTLQSPVQQAEGNKIACDIINNRKDIVAWLQGRGFPGKYVLGGLEMNAKEYEKRIV